MELVPLVDTVTADTEVDMEADLGEVVLVVMADMAAVMAALEWEVDKDLDLLNTIQEVPISLMNLIKLQIKIMNI